MDVDKSGARIAIEITHPDTGVQELFFQQFEEFKNLLHGALQEEWKWELWARDEHGKTVSRIGTALYGVSIFQKDDWPALISFFKPRIIALGDFWDNVKDGFEALK